MKPSALALIGGVLLLIVAVSGGGSGPAPSPAVKPPIEGGNAVLIVYESGKLLPVQQAPIINSTRLRDWAESHQAEFRAWDYRTQVTRAEDSRFVPALKASRPSLPWLYGTIGGKGVDQALPQNIDATLQALDKVAK